MQTKVQSCATDINIQHQETKSFECQAYAFEIDEEIKQMQKTPLELLNLEMWGQITKEFDEKTKDPNSLLPTDLESIKMNKDPQYIHHREKEQPATRHLGTRGMDTMNFQKDDRPKVSTRMRTGEFATSKIGDGAIGHTENSNKSKNVSNVNTQVIDHKLDEFMESLKGDNRHLVMSENENKLMQSGKNYLKKKNF